MNIIGKIFVFAVFVMSLMLMTFAGAIYMSHVNWKDEVERLPKDCLPGQQPGYGYLLKESIAAREKVEQEITDLKRKVAESEQTRDQLIAKLQTAVVQKEQELQTLRADKQKRQDEMEKAVADVRTLREDLLTASKNVDQLQAQVKRSRTRSMPRSESPRNSPRNSPSPRPN